jgi:peroxiredoxin
MTPRSIDHPLQPGDRAPNIVFDAISREGKIALDDFRGRSPLLVGLFRGLHCPFCRRHVAAMAHLNLALKEKGIECLAVVKTPVERARLYFRYHPLPDLLAASDPQGVSHRAFGLPILEFTENETEWPQKVGMDVVMTMRIDMPGELPEPMNPAAAGDLLSENDGYEITEADQQVMIPGHMPLIGEFLPDREGVVRWSFTEAEEGGRNVCLGPSSEELMSAACKVAH